LELAAESSLDCHADIIYVFAMSTLEIAELCEALPLEKREEVADFARFLLARQHDVRWENILAEPKTRYRLDAFLCESAAEADEALDRRRL
jgi:hypothetical protein